MNTNALADLTVKDIEESLLPAPVFVRMIFPDDKKMQDTWVVGLIHSRMFRMDNDPLHPAGFYAAITLQDRSAYTRILPLTRILAVTVPTLVYLQVTDQAHYIIADRKQAISSILQSDVPEKEKNERLKELFSVHLHSRYSPITSTTTAAPVTTATTMSPNVAVGGMSQPKPKRGLFSNLLNP